MDLQTVVGQTKAEVAARATGATGLAKLLGIIPDVLAIVAICAGMTISILLYRKQDKKLNLEIELLEKQNGP